MDIVHSETKTTVVMQPIHSILYYQPANVQRMLNEEYIEYLVNDQIKEYGRHNQFSILQSITCGDLENKRYVLDGQHRIEAFKRLSVLNYNMNQFVPIIVYKCDTLEELHEYYVRINQNHPINPLELSQTWFNHGKELCSKFMERFKAYTKNSKTTCNCPYINLMELVNYLKNRKVFERLQSYVTSSTGIVDTLMSKIDEFNVYLYKNYTHITTYQLSSEINERFAKCYQKSPHNPCFLGVWRRMEWLEICVCMIVQNLRTEDLKLSEYTSKRIRIPAVTKNNVWKKRNGTLMEGSCFVCGESLSYHNMECGHIVPHVLNGSVEVSNLEPICKLCNRDMGAMNLFEYKQLNYTKEKRKSNRLFP